MQDAANFKLDVEVSNDDALAGGTAQITVTATLTENGKVPTESYELDFELTGDVSAKFTDTGNEKTSGNATPSNGGVVIKYFTDMKAEQGSVGVHHKFDDGSLVHDDKDFQFDAPDPDKIVLSLDHQTVEAGDGTITATAIATLNDATFTGGGSVNFLLVPEDVNAVFSNDLKEIKVPLDKTTGKANATFTSPLWEMGTCEVWWDLSDENKAHDKKDYTFSAPKLTVTLNPMTTQADGGADAPIVECVDAPAATYVDSSKPAGFTATALFKKPTGDLWTNGGEVLFQFDDQKSAQLAPGQTVTPGDTNQWWVPLGTTDPNKGKASLAFYDTTAESIVLSAYAPDLGRTDGPDYDSGQVNFKNPWHGVSEYDIQYEGQYTSAWIYANGVQQAKLLITLTLIDKNNKPLHDAEMPSAEDVDKVLTLLNYQTGEELIDDDKDKTTIGPWHYTRVENEWRHETVDAKWTYTPRSVAPSNSGKIQLTYYVTGNTPNTSIAFGFSITPTGGQVTSTGTTDTATGILEGQYTEPSPKLTFSQQDTTFDTTCRLRTEQLPTYDVSSLSITGKHVDHTGENDTGPAGGNGTVDTDGNFWRQWDYSIALSQDMKTPDDSQLQLSKCVLDADGVQRMKGNDYCFASRANSYWYIYKGYLWPVNLTVDTTKGGPVVPATTKTGIMNAIGAQDQTYTFPPATSPPTINFTLYMAFQGRTTNENRNDPFNVTLYDQFGNNQTYSFSNNNLVQNYDLTQTFPNSIKGWNPVTVGPRWNKFSTAGPVQPRKLARKGTPGTAWSINLFLCAQNSNNPMYAGKTLNKTWWEAVVGPTYCVTEIWAVTFEGDYRYASTAVTRAGQVVGDNLDKGAALARFDGPYPNALAFVNMDDDVEKWDLMPFRLTPVWSKQCMAIYFLEPGKYVYHASANIGAGTHDTAQLAAFNPSDDSFLWYPVAVN